MIRRSVKSAAFAWDLLIWSRVRKQHITPASMQSLLATKGIATPPPSLTLHSPNGALNHFEDGFAAVYATLCSNLRTPNALSRYRHAVPSRAFRGIYLWDSAFIAQIWKWWDADVAADILRSVVAARDGDRLMHVASDLARSPLTQPPLIAWSLASLLEVSGDVALASELYQALKAYHEWLRTNRQLPNGLYAWKHPYESGIDNSPRFADRAEKHFAPTDRTAAPDFSTYMTLDCEALSAIARKINKVAEAKSFAVKGEELRSATNRFLWHKKDALYYDRNSATKAYAEIQTIASLLPLWADIPNAARAAKLREMIIDPNAFGTPLPLPSVARSDPTFELDMWRGPVWVNVAYGVLLGLRRYGFLSEAAELGWRLCDGIYKTYEQEGYFYEFYNPEGPGTATLTRKRGNMQKRIALGNKPQRNFIGWTGLVNNIVIEMLFGLSKSRGEYWLQPAFPSAAVGGRFVLTLPSSDTSIELKVFKHKVQGKVTRGDRTATFDVGLGERINLDTLLTKAATTS